MSAAREQFVHMRGQYVNGLLVIHSRRRSVLLFLSLEASSSGKGMFCFVRKHRIAAIFYWCLSDIFIGASTSLEEGLSPLQRGMWLIVPRSWKGIWETLVAHAHVPCTHKLNQAANQHLFFFFSFFVDIGIHKTHHFSTLSYLPPFSPQLKFLWNLCDLLRFLLISRGKRCYYCCCASIQTHTYSH